MLSALTLALGAPMRMRDGSPMPDRLPSGAIRPEAPPDYPGRVPNMWSQMPAHVQRPVLAVKGEHTIGDGSVGDKGIAWKDPNGNTYDTAFYGSFTPRVAAAAAFCSYRNSKFALDGTWGRDEKVLVTEACNIVNSWGWVLYEEHQLYDPITNDTDNADLWFNGVSGTSDAHGTHSKLHDSDLIHGGNCMVAIHGASLDQIAEKDGDSIYEQAFNVPGLDKRWLGELDVILDLFVKQHGNLKGLAEGCPGELYVTGHGLGGAVAQMFAYLLNKNGDPLNTGRETGVAKLHTFGSPPVANFTLTNDKFMNTSDPQADGCFHGIHYYSRVPPGTPGQSEMYDIYGIFTGHHIDDTVMTALRKDSIMGTLGNIDDWIDSEASKHIKMSWESLDMIGLVDGDESPNIIGPVLHTSCVDGQAPHLTLMSTDVTIAVDSANNALEEWASGSLSLHSAETYMHLMKGQDEEVSAQIARDMNDITIDCLLDACNEPGTGVGRYDPNDPGPH